MRLKKREITDDSKIDAIIESAKCIRLGFNDNGEVYIVPLDFGFENKDGQRIFYFHGASEGRKIDLIKKAPHVGIELDVSAETMPADNACGFTTHYQSIIGTGEASLITDLGEKMYAMEKVMGHLSGKEDWEIPENALEKMSHFKVVVTELSAKENM